MSSYSDYADSASRILTHKGDALATAKANSAATWGNTIANLGQVIPQQVQQALKQRAEQKKQKQIQDIFAGEDDLPTKIQRVYQVDPEMGSKLGKEYGEAQKTTYELAALKHKYESDKLNYALNKLGAASDESSYASAILGLKEAGEDVSAYPLHYTPETVKAVNLQLMTAKERLDASKPKEPRLFNTAPGNKIFDETGKMVAENPYQLTPDQIADNARQDAAAQATAAQRDIENKRASAMLSLAQQRELRESQNSKEPLIAVMKDGKAVLVKRSQAEGMTPASGESGTKELTQAQTLDAGYAHRIDDAETTLKKVEPSIAKMGLLKFTAESHFPAKAQSAEFQQYDQASRNLINAVLRRESGAAISQSEFDNAKRQYLPQPGDDPETLKLKAQNRKRQKDALAAGAGRAYTPDTPPLGPQEGDTKPIPGFPGTEQTYRNGKWIRTK